MSEVASTNAFDKNPQSRQRGITLDLGFSSLVVPAPPHLAEAGGAEMQITLVDCPGHASLIRTIIGGAQIVDLMLLAGLIWLMLESSRYWPIWVAACQLMTVLTHIVTLLLGNFSDRIYAGLSTVWVIPLMLFTIIGIELDRKASHDRAYSA